MPFDFHADAYAGRDVAKALGFDPHGMVEMNLKFRAGDLLVVTTEQLVPAEKLPKVIGEIVKRKYIVNCVAETPEQRHDEPTCCGERHVTECRSADAAADETSQPDVGEGWRLLGADEVLQEGDQCDVGANEPCWVNTVCVGDRAGDGCVGGGCDRYRRRVTPELTSIAADEPVSARCDTVRLRAEVERLRRAAGSWEREAAAHAEEVERLRLTEEEREAISRIAFLLEQHRWRDAPTIKGIADRLGGGE